MWAAGSCQVSNPVARRRRAPSAVRRSTSPGVSPSDEQPGEQLQQDLGLGVAAHRPEHGAQRAVGPGDERRRQRVRRAAARARTRRGGPARARSRCPRLCSRTPVPGTATWHPKPDAFDWMRLTPIRRRRRRRGGSSPPSRCGLTRSAARSGRKRAAASVEPLVARSTSGASAPVGKHARGGRRRPAGRLDEEVGPGRVVDIGQVVASSRSAMPAAGQGEVALRVRRDGPDVVAPHAAGRAARPSRRSELARSAGEYSPAPTSSSASPNSPS